MLVTMLKQNLVFPDIPIVGEHVGEAGWNMDERSWSSGAASAKAMDALVCSARYLATTQPAARAPTMAISGASSGIRAFPISVVCIIRLITGVGALPSSRQVIIQDLRFGE